MTLLQEVGMKELFPKGRSSGNEKTKLSVAEKMQNYQAKWFKVPQQEAVASEI